MIYPVHAFDAPEKQDGSAIESISQVATQGNDLRKRRYLYSPGRVGLAAKYHVAPAERGCG